MLVPKFICEVGYACGFASSIVGGGLWDTISIAQRARPKSLTLEKGNLGSAREYKRLHNEKMERLEGQRGIMLNQIRRDAMGFGIAAHTIFCLLDELMKPLAEAYFNPKKPRLPTPANKDRREPDRSS